MAKQKKSPKLSHADFCKDEKNVDSGGDVHRRHGLRNVSQNQKVKKKKKQINSPRIPYKGTYMYVRQYIYVYICLCVELT